MKQSGLVREQKPLGMAAKRGVIPLYHRIYLLLLQSISDHTFPPDRSMPAEVELASQLGVSRITLRAALERLEREGLVRRERGRGTFPVADKLSDTATLSEGLRSQISLALRTSVEVLEYGPVPASGPIAAAMNVEAGEKVLRIVRVRRDRKSPVSHSVCHVPWNLKHVLPRQRISSLPISTILTSSGVELAAFQERLSARIADPEVAELLGIEVGSPLLSLTRGVRAPDGRVLEHLRVLYRPDRYEYTVEYAGEDAADDTAKRRPRMVTTHV